MTAKEYCTSHDAIAYYSGLSGLEIHGIEYGVDDYVYCASGAWVSLQGMHRSAMSSRHTRSLKTITRNLYRLSISTERQSIMNGSSAKFKNL